MNSEFVVENRELKAKTHRVTRVETVQYSPANTPWPLFLAALTVSL